MIYARIYAIQYGKVIEMKKGTQYCFDNGGYEITMKLLNQKAHTAPL